MWTAFRGSKIVGCRIMFALALGSACAVVQPAGCARSGKITCSAADDAQWTSRRAAVATFAAAALTAPLPAFAAFGDPPVPMTGKKTPTAFDLAARAGQKKAKKDLPWSVQQGCNVEKPCAKGATLFGPSAGLGAKPPGK